MTQLHETRHWMLDIETLAKSHRAAVWEVGIAEFRIDDAGRVRAVGSPAVFFLRPAMQVGREEDTDTLRWMQENPQVWERYEQAQNGKLGNIVSIDQLYARLASLIAENHHIWCKGASFDFSIMKSLFGGKVPWNFRHENCMRGFINLAKLLGWQQPPTMRLHDTPSDIADQLILLDGALTHLRDNMRHPVSAPPMFKSTRGDSAV